jgi:hypothetical protein
MLQIEKQALTVYLDYRQQSSLWKAKRGNGYDSRMPQQQNSDRMGVRSGNGMVLGASFGLVLGPTLGGPVIGLFIGAVIGMLVGYWRASRP